MKTIVGLLRPWSFVPAFGAACFWRKTPHKKTFFPFLGKVLMDDSGKSVYLLNRLVNT
jgi:hypothetical protein